MEAGGPSKRLMYTPHLKKVLKTYQASATNSLHGPNSVMGVWPGSESDDTPSVSPPSVPTSTNPDQPAVVTASTSSKDVPDYDPFIAPPPFPIQQPPIFTPSDQTSCKKSETVLEGETISCFNVGGEERLCLPQILNTVLRDFSLHQINGVCDNLYIYCSRCNCDQLNVLKATGVIPFNAPSCGLITKTDAQRLCAALLDCNPLVFTKPDMKPPFQIPVYHECFGRCSGLYMPDLFQYPLAPCVECAECHGLLSPQKFVCHVHHPKETRTCHWGFDVLKWRAYILLEVGHEDNVQFQEALSDMKERFSVVCKRKQAVDENCDLSCKKIRPEGCYPYAVDPMLVYYYGPQVWGENAAAFQTYPVITKDGKTLYIPPPSDNFPPILQKSFRNRLSLSTPANVQKLKPIVKEEFPYHTTTYSKSDVVGKRLKKEPDQDSPSCHLDSEDTFSDTSFSTLSAGTEDGLVVEEEEEFQQSTETEFLELKKILTDVDASLRTKILSEVELLIAKYRKCLKVAVQGKKLYQMELEKLHYTQKGKLRKLRERNKLLEKELLKLQNNSSVVDNSKSEQFESQSSTRQASPNNKCSTSPERCDSPETNKTVETAGILANAVKSEQLDEEEDKTVSSPSPVLLPKLSPEPLCQQ